MLLSVGLRAPTDKSAYSQYSQ